MSEDPRTIIGEPKPNLLEETLKKRISVNKGKIEFLDESQSEHPRVSELLVAVNVTQGKEIPEILINSINNNGQKTEAARLMEEWNTKLRANTPHLSPDSYRMMLLIDFWGQGENEGFWHYINNTKKTATAIFGDPGVLFGTPQYKDIVPGLEKQFYKELGINALYELSNPA